MEKPRKIQETGLQKKAKGLFWTHFCLFNFNFGKNLISLFW